MTPMDTETLKMKALALLEKPQAFLAIVGLVLLLDAAFILRWQVVSLGKVFKETRRLKSDIVATYDESKETEAQKVQLKEYRARYKEMNNMIIGPQDLPKVLESISRFADIASVRILRIRPVDVARSGGSEGDKFVRQKISITAKSGYHQLGRFVGLLESAPIFIDIKNLEVKGDQAQPGKQHLTILLEVLKRTAYNEQTAYNKQEEK